MTVETEAPTAKPKVTKGVSYTTVKTINWPEGLKIYNKFGNAITR